MGFAALGPLLVGMMQAAVVGALVGAVVGGLTAAISGGNIMKGVLHGAVGGAVVGALTFGVGKMFTGLKELGSAATTTSSVTKGSTTFMGNETARALGTEAAGGTIKQGASTSFIGKLGDSLGEGWKGIKEGAGAMFGEGGGALEGAMAKGAVSAGISTVGNLYAQKKALSAADAMAEKEHERSLEKIDKQGEWNMKLAGARGGGGGGGGRSVEDELAIVRAQSEGAIARTKAEIEGQRQLREQEYAEQDELRNLASQAGSGLSTGGGNVRSQSGESLVDIQERIRQGEDVQGQPNPATIVPVQYALQGAV